MVKDLMVQTECPWFDTLQFQLTFGSMLLAFVLILHLVSAKFIRKVSSNSTSAVSIPNCALYSKFEPLHKILLILHLVPAKLIRNLSSNSSLPFSYRNRTFILHFEILNFPSKMLCEPDEHIKLQLHDGSQQLASHVKR